MIYLHHLLVYFSCVTIFRENLQIAVSSQFDTGPKKYFFGYTSISYFRHNVSANGVEPDSKKVEAIKKFLRPSGKTEELSFLSLARYYCHFIKHLTKIASPLHALTSDKVPFKW